MNKCPFGGFTLDELRMRLKGLVKLSNGHRHDKYNGRVREILEEKIYSDIEKIKEDTLGKTYIYGERKKHLYWSNLSSLGYDILHSLFRAYPERFMDSNSNVILEFALNRIDSLLIEAIESSHSRDDYHHLKNHLRQCVLLMASLDNHTEAHLNRRRALPGESFHFEGMEEAIRRKEGFSRCPGVDSGYLGKLFDALHTLYGEKYLPERLSSIHPDSSPASRVTG